TLRINHDLNLTDCHMILFISDIIDYYTLKTVKIASLVNVFLMVHGNGIGVGLLLWEDPRPNLITLSSTFSNMEIDDLVESDTCIWSLSNDDSFLVNSVRKHIDEHSLPSLFPCTQWYKMIPKKVIVFMWRMLLDRLPNRLNLSSYGLDIDLISCMVCNGHVESNDHIFFTCDMAVAIWNLVRSWIDLPLPIFLSCED
nr:RNA-directed DNA polymerase, eukaryota [Tanacetum cinerariifolium]